MKRPFVQLLVGLVCGGMFAAGAWSFAADEPSAKPAPVAQVAAAEPTPEMAECDSAGCFTVRTGQTFEGLHLQGVIPCSSMVVKGGGNLVILSRHDMPLASCSYHVKTTKRITLNGHSYELTVIGEDQIRAMPIKDTELAARS